MILHGADPAGTPFWKLAGGGNDFVVFDHRQKWIVDASELTRRICTRRLSTGADGLILIETSATADLRMLYFNSDGSRGEFCGNGTRCAARFAFLNQVAPAAMTIETDSGIIPARVDGTEVELTLPSPTEFELSRPLVVDGRIVEGSFVVVGVPHYVVFVEGDLWALDVETSGRKIRRHPDLQPRGANVNFVRVVADDEIEVRTYERGVESETLSCGSGVVASATVSAMSRGVRSPLSVLTRSGITLRVGFDVPQQSRNPRNLTLRGDARVVYQAVLTEDTIRGFDPEWAREPGRRRAPSFVD